MLSNLSKKAILQHTDTTLAVLFSEPQTAKSVETSPVEMLRLEQAGLVVRRGIVKTGERGRPAIIWGLSRKARSRVRRAQAA